MSKVTCSHCGEIVLESNAVPCSDANHTWHYCLSCDLGFTLAAARNAGVKMGYTREQSKAMCEAVRNSIKIEGGS